jgi:hypothetical protein
LDEGEGDWGFVRGLLTFVQEGRNEPRERRACIKWYVMGREGEKYEFFVCKLAIGVGMDVW